MSVATATSFEVREAIAQVLRRQIRGLQAQPYVMANPTPPSADVRRGPVEYDQAMHGGVTHWTFLVRVYVAGATDRGAQNRLDVYLNPTGAGSIKAAIESDTTLGGIVSDLQVTTATGEQAYELNGTQVLGSEWTVEVWL